MLLNPSKSIVPEATTQSTSGTFSISDIISLENGHLASFPQSGSQKIQGRAHCFKGLYLSGDYQAYVCPSPRLQNYVALKILKADISHKSRELSILLHMSKPKTNHPGKSHVVQLLDHFEHKGPNGLHLCLVFPIMLSDGEAMTVREKPRYSAYVREISKQILQGLEYIHELGLIHGGTYLGHQVPKFTKVDPI
jgi:serine/threonine protein kinase